MNQTLEKMAQAIFKSWFIDFDPVHAKAEGRDTGLPKEIADLFPDSFEDSELGMIPKGWEVGTLGDVVEIYDSKRIPLSRREREKRQGPFPYYGATSIMDYVDDYIFDGIYVLIGEDGSVINEDGTPFMQYVWGKIWVNNHAHVLQGKSYISTEHIYVHLSQTNVSAYVTGAVQLKINQGNLKRIPFILPSEDVAIMFEDILKSYYSQYRNNVEESRTLSTLRDTLLPKLISGELPIPNAEQLAGGTL
jgi:type I restriction enzyme S subunit